MEGRNFHTALLGGFRKKDVVQFLAEDKRQQEELLRDLRQQLKEAESQVAGMMEERDNLLEKGLELQGKLDQMESLPAELERAQAENVRLQQELEAARAAKEEAQTALTRLQARLEHEAGAAAEQLQALREEQQNLYLRAEQLEAQLRQQPRSKPGVGESSDQLWNLCGKMERTLRQMERMMDGPYRMTCYPEPAEECPVEEPAYPPEPQPVVEVRAERVEQPAEQAPSVKNLLQRIRVKR